MIFTFWTGSSIPNDATSIGAWRERYPRFAVFQDADVLPLLPSDQVRDLYNRIKIPSCKSDLARLVLLKEHGGLYIDAHSGPSNGDNLARTIAYLARYEFIIFRWLWLGGFTFGNGYIAARRGTPILDLLVDRAIKNLLQQKKKEDEANEYVPYQIAVLTGTQVILGTIFEPCDGSWAIRQQYKDKVLFYEMTGPDTPGFHVANFYNYRKPGSHWSERQKVERLFDLS